MKTEAVQLPNGEWVMIETENPNFNHWMSILRNFERFIIKQYNPPIELASKNYLEAIIAIAARDF